MDFLSYFALAILFFVVLTLAYGMIAIHDIPYHMARSGITPTRMRFMLAGGSVSSPFMRSGPFSGFGPPHITRCMAMAGDPGKKLMKKRTHPSPAVGNTNSLRRWTY